MGGNGKRIEQSRLKMWGWRRGETVTLLSRMAREGFIEKIKCKEKNVRDGELSMHISEKITPEKGHSQYKHWKEGTYLVKVQYRGRSGWNTVCKGKCVGDNVRGGGAINYCEVLVVLEHRERDVPYNENDVLFFQKLWNWNSATVEISGIIFFLIHITTYKD